MISTIIELIFSRSGDILAVQNEKIKPSQRCKQNSTPSNTVVALYSYKPQKSDELELKKGCKHSKITRNFS